MEGAHITSSNDPENIFNVDPSPKEKKKKSIFEFAVQKDTEDKTRHVAQEALKIRQIEEAPKAAAETQVETVEKHMTPEERQYAAQVLTKERRLQRTEQHIATDPTPAVEAGEMLVEEWEDRIVEGGQDFSAAYEKVLSVYDIPDTIPEGLSEKPTELAPADSTAHEFPLHHEDTLTISHEEPATRALIEDEPNQYIQEGESRPPDPNAEMSLKEALEESMDTDEPEPTLTPAQPSKPKIERKAKTEPVRTSTLNSIVGNFLGRRRGQGKAEQKLMPVQKSLEREVGELQAELKDKETKIRALAAEHIRTKGDEALEPIRQQSVKERVEIAESMEKDPLNSIESFTAAAEARMSAPKAHELHGSGAGERIGQVIVHAEQNTHAGRTPEARIKPPVKLPENKRVEQLSRQELIEVSGEIEVEGTTLRKIYETHLIGEKALRRLVAEHMNGGDVVRALQQEIVEHEIDFERDPAMRDMDLQSSENDGGEIEKTDVAPGKESLNQLLEKASANITEADDPLSHYSQKPPEPEKELPAVTQTAQKQRKKADVVMVSTILALAVAIVVLYFWHG